MGVHTIVPGRTRDNLAEIAVSIATAAFLLAGAMWIRLPFDEFVDDLARFKWQFVSIPLIYAVVLYAVKTRPGAMRRDYALWLTNHLWANAMAWLVSLAFVYGQGVGRLGRGVLGLFGVLHAVVSPMVRVTLDGAATRWRPRRAVLVGTGLFTQKLAETLRNTPAAGMIPSAAVVLGDAKVELPGWLTVYSGSAGLRDIVESHRIDCVVLTPPYIRDDDLVMQLVRCRLDGLEIRDGVDLYEEVTGRVPLEDIADYWALFLSVTKVRAVNATLKRLLDVVVASVLLVVALPVMIATALAVKLGDNGPILFFQERLGQYGQQFLMMKFRTMVPDAEATTGPVMAGLNDPRVTRVGRVLRKYRLDELPQLVNVLRGQMSIVGPRPEREVFVLDFAQRIPIMRPGRRRTDMSDSVFLDGWREAINLYSSRLLVKPGLTGWAQVNYPYASTFAENREQFEFDLYYIKNHSILFDIAIIVRTVRVFLYPSGR